MYNEEVHYTFMELRAEGWSLANISREMGIYKPTLLHWDHKFRNEIHDLKMVHLEDLQQSRLPDYRDYLCKLGILATNIDAVLVARANLLELSVDQLMRARAMLQAEMEKERARVAGWKQQAKWKNNEDPSLRMIDGKPYIAWPDPKAIEALEELRQKEAQEAESQEGDLQEEELEEDESEEDESEEGELQEDDESPKEPPFQDAA